MVIEQEPKIIPGQIRKAREELDLSINEVAKELGINPNGVSDWEIGKGEPSIEQLIALSHIFQRSSDYFFKPLSGLPEKVNFRLKKATVFAELPVQTRKTIVRFDELCRAETELENILGRKRTIDIIKTAGYISSESLATRERHRLTLDDKPIKDIRTLLEKIGVRVFVLGAGTKELSGMSWWHREYGPCMLINADDKPSGRRTFTMAHEYAHLVVNKGATICSLDFNVSNSEERYANEFASYFLMPALDLRREFSLIVGEPGNLPDGKQLGVISSRYGVSLEALSRRLESLSLIPEGSTEKYINEWNLTPPHYRSGKGPKWKKRLGEQFVSLATDAHTTGYISVGKLAQLLDIDIRKASEFSQ